MADNFLKIRNGVNLNPQASEPSGTEGMIYYNSGLQRFRKYENGQWRNLSAENNYVTLVGGGTVSWDLATTSVSFTADIFVEVAGLNYSDNKIPLAESPLVLPTTNHVAYIDSINITSGGPNLTLSVGLITSITDRQVIIARRDGADVIVGTDRLADGDAIKLYQTGVSGGDTVYTENLNNNQSSPAAFVNMSLNSATEKGAVIDYYVSRYHHTADPGTSINTSFGKPLQSFQTTIGTGFNDVVYSIAKQSDDKVIVAGPFTSLNGVTRNRVVRLTPQGSVDWSFYTNMNGASGAYPLVVAVQSDGKVLVAGAFSTFGGVTKNKLVRLNSDGSEDSSFYTQFSSTVTLSQPISSIAVQSDGKILIGGNFSYTVSGNTRYAIARLNSNGSLDTTFIPTSFASGGTEYVYAIDVQSDGKILIGGNFTSLRNRIARLGTTGLEDTTFGTALGTAFNSTVYSIKVLAGNDMLIGGGFNSYQGTITGGLVKLDVNATKAASFHTNLGSGINGTVKSIGFQSDSSIIVTGGFTTVNSAIVSVRMAKISSAGVFDSTFASNLGTGFNQEVSTAAILSDDKIIAGGQFTTVNGNSSGRSYIGKISSTGAEYTTAEYTYYGLMNNGFVYSIAKQTDGKIIAGGEFTYFNGISRNRLVRLNSDGSEDTAFSTNLGTGFNNTINVIAIQSDGKILVGGGFTSFNGATRNYLVRLNSDGTSDSTFYTNLGTGAFNGQVNSVVVLSDGSILVGGNFTTLGVNTRNRMVKLSSTGVDNSAFYTSLGTGFDGIVRDIKVQSDNKILVGGGFSTFNGNTRNKLVRLDSLGIEDSGFYVNLGTGFDSDIYALRVQSDGKILVGGSFTTLNSISKKYLVRLNASGIEDSSFYSNFTVSSGLNSNVYGVNIQTDGKIVVVGLFTTFNGNSRNRIIRLKSTGTEDTAFYTALGTGFDVGPTYSGVYCVELISSTEMLAGGAFTNLGTNTAGDMAKINYGLDLLNAVTKTGSFKAMYRPYEATWELGGFDGIGDDVGVTFTINSSGQGYYTSTNLSGTLIESLIRYKISKL